MRGVKYRILVIDKDREEFDKLRVLLGERFYCEFVDKPETALISLKRKYFNAILSELELGEISGISLLKNIRASYPNYNFVIFSAGNIKLEYAIEAIKNNVNGILLKPLISEESVASFKLLLENNKPQLKRISGKKYRVENHLHLVIPATEEDIINAMNVADQMTNLLYPVDYGNFVGVKIALYEALNNAKQYGSNSDKDLINLRIDFRFDRIACHVKDQGRGFEHGTLNFQQLNKTYTGLNLIKTLMDEVSFNSKGSEINFLKLIDSKPAQENYNIIN